LLQLSGICRYYPPPESGCAPVTALEQVSLHVRPGEFVSIIGHSGSGKSTLMHILGCLDRPDSGNYVLDGIDTCACTAAQRAAIRREHIGFIFQSFHLIEGSSALENVELPLIFRGISSRERKQLARHALETVGLSARMHHRPGELSGGQQQRVAIARAIAAAPGLLLADEPTGNLDTENSAQIMELLCSLHRQGHTLVLITHDPAVAARAQRTLRLENGRLLDDYA